MANASEIASLITQGLKPPQGTQDVSYHTGIIKSWDPVSGVNTVDVNGVILSNLASIQNGMGVSYLPGDVVQVQRVQTKYSIVGRASAPNGLTGSSPVSLTTAGGDITGATGVWRDLDNNDSPRVTVRVGNACLVSFGVAGAVTQNAILDISIAATGPANVDPGAFQGWTCSTGLTDTIVENGVYRSVSAPSKQLMFYRNTGVGFTNGKLNWFTPGVYTFFLKYRITTSPPGTIFTRAESPWLTVIPF